jgi:hypothetical protein
MSMTDKQYRGLIEANSKLNDLPMDVATYYARLVGDRPRLAPDGKVIVREKGKEIARIKLLFSDSSRTSNPAS